MIERTKMRKQTRDSVSMMRKRRLSQGSITLPLLKAHFDTVSKYEGFPGTCYMSAVFDVNSQRHPCIEGRSGASPCPANQDNVSNLCQSFLLTHIINPSRPRERKLNRLPPSCNFQLCHLRVPLVSHHPVPSIK